MTKERLHFGDTKIYVIPSVSTIARRLSVLKRIGLPFLQVLASWIRRKGFNMSGVSLLEMGHWSQIQLDFAPRPEFMTGCMSL